MKGFPTLTLMLVGLGCPSCFQGLDVMIFKPFAFGCGVGEKFSIFQTK